MNAGTYKEGNTKESNNRKLYYEASKYGYYRLNIEGKLGVIEKKRLLWIDQKGFNNININKKKIIALLR